MTAQRVPFCRTEITPEAQQAAVRVLASGWVTTGAESFAFEQEFGDWVQAPYTIAVSSCTAAIEMALTALGLPAGAPVLTPALTFCGAVQAIIHAGLRPVLVDTDEATLTVSAEGVAKAARDGAAAMVIQHMGGYPVDGAELAAAAGIPVGHVAVHGRRRRHEGELHRPAGGHRPGTTAPAGGLAAAPGGHRGTLRRAARRHRRPRAPAAPGDGYARLASVHRADPPAGVRDRPGHGGRTAGRGRHRHLRAFHPGASPALLPQPDRPGRVRRTRGRGPDLPAAALAATAPRADRFRRRPSVRGTRRSRGLSRIRDRKGTRWR